MFKYSRLEWIGNFDKNGNVIHGYIELPYYPSSSTRIVLDAAFLSSGGVFGNGSNNTTAAFWAIAETSYLHLARGNYSSYSGNRVYDYTNYLDNIKRTYEFGQVYIKVNDVVKAQGNNPKSFTNLGYKLKLFTGSYTGSTPAKQKLSEFHIYEETSDPDFPEKEIMHLIPVIRWLDNAIGFYDTINDSFYPTNANFSRGKIQDLTNYTENMELRIGYDASETTHKFIDQTYLNFTGVDNYYVNIKNRDNVLLALMNDIATKFVLDASSKDYAWTQLRQKLNITPGYNVVSNTLISKLTDDYTKSQIDALIASNDDLDALIDSICNLLMQDYYTKAEVDEIVEAGSGGHQMDNYYNKTEIDELIPEKENLDVIQQFLESRTEYYNNLKIFTKLNGKEN